METFIVMVLACIAITACDKDGSNGVVNKIQELQENTWRANKFRTTGQVQMDVSANHWDYAFTDGVGVHTVNNVVSGDGFTYSVNDDQITLSGASEEHLPNGTYYYWFENDHMYFNGTPTIPADDVPMIEFVKQ